MKFIKVILITFFIMPSVVWGAVFNVDNVADIQNALTTAQSNSEDDTISIEAGTYTVNTTLTYGADIMENFAVTIHGAGADLTILDGSNTTQILTVSTRILSTDAHVTVRDITFRNGKGSAPVEGGLAFGGGLSVSTYEASITVENSGFINNSADLGGGVNAISSYSGGTVALINNTFNNNSADQNGGGAYASSMEGSVILRNNKFSDNSANQFGGGAGAFSGSGQVVLTNNIFSNNTATMGGGAYAFSGSDTTTFTNNTFVNNSADLFGGGFYTMLITDIYNNIIWGNTASSGGDMLVATGGDAKVNLFNNNYHDFWIDTENNLSQGNNIDEDPLLDSTYHLQQDSSCIDTGTNSAPEIPPYTDFEEAPRIVNGTVDIGADEYKVTTGNPFHPYDKNQDWSIGDFELLDAIDVWAEGNLEDFDLLDLIDYWAYGSYCWDVGNEKHKAGTPDESGACQ